MIITAEEALVNLVFFMLGIFMLKLYLLHYTETTTILE